MPLSDKYELKRLQAPKVRGVLFDALIRILEAPVVGKLFIGHLLRTSGFRSLDSVDVAGVVATPFGGPDWSHQPPKEDMLPHAIRWATDGGLPSAADYRNAYLCGATTPTQVLDCLLALLDELDKGDTPLAAVIPVSKNPRGLELLRAMAAESTERYASGQSLSEWDGVPVLLKDSLTCTGWISGCGSGPIRDVQKPSESDSAVVAMFRERGALLVPCANMSEIGLSVQGYNNVSGQCRNPHNLGHVSGGSSSGCASAVAAGLFPVSLGADGGGSIRLPSSLCGVVGLKTTHCRVPGEGDVCELCPSVSVLGPICASAADCLAVMNVIATKGPGNIPKMAFDPSAGDDANAAGPEQISVTDGKPFAGLKIGVFSQWFDDCSPEVRQICRAAVARMVELGATVVEVNVRGLEPLRVAHAVIITSEMLIGFKAMFGGEKEAEAAIKHTGCDVRTKLRVTAVGMTAKRQDLARKVTTLAIGEIERALSQCDVIATPATAVPAPRVCGNLRTGESDVMTESQLMQYMLLANCTGHPGVSFPVGVTKAGRLPVGLQLMGPAWSEATLLKVAAAWEASAGRVHPTAVPLPAERTGERCRAPIRAGVPGGGSSVCACPLWAATAATGSAAAAGGGGGGGA